MREVDGSTSESSVVLMCAASHSLEPIVEQHADATAHLFIPELWDRRGGLLLLYTGVHPIQDNLPLERVRRMVSERRAIGAMWTYDWDALDGGPWFVYVCDNPAYDLDQIEGKSARKHVRRALSCCDVKRVEMAWLAEHGYETLRKASDRYTNYSVMRQEAFRDHMSSLVAAGDYECFGVFVQDNLAAYALLRVASDDVLLASAKFDPAFSPALPMYALYFTLGRHYLVERRCRRIIGGSRELLHQTNIGEFRLKMGWRKAYCRLGLYLKPWLRAALAIARPSRPLCRLLLPPLRYAMLHGLLEAQHIARSTQRGRC